MNDPALWPPVDPQQSDAIRVVDEYLQAMENRDLSTAAGFWGDSVEIIAVGGVRYTDLASMAAGTAGRYQRVAKTRTTYLHWADGDQTRVASQGTLYGRLSDGAEFHDVRYLDLFTLVDGQICRQEFYNDFGG